MTTTERDVLEVAREAGLTILLDGRIGQQEYQSVSGSAEALHRFARAMRDAPHDVFQRVRVARSRNANALVPARMRERIASVVYGGSRAGASASSGVHARRRLRVRP
jgi:hypothetical protein